MVAVLVIVLSTSDRRRAATNAFVRESGVQLRLLPGERHCQRQDVPAHADAVRLFADPFVVTGGPLAVTVTEGGRLVSRGRATTGREGPVAVGLAPAPGAEVPGAGVCITNRGVTPIELDGNQTPPGGSSLDVLFEGQQRPPDDVRVDFLRRGSESWWRFAPAIADRLGLRKAAFFGSWTMWAVFVLVALTWAAGLLLLRREAPGR
ncbi:MAG: hypothetical protein M3356_03085 [Actinomycetota bacterium]|nr:hypothetical protein [Actinomycetota bacterium]